MDVSFRKRAKVTEGSPGQIRSASRPYNLNMKYMNLYQDFLSIIPECQRDIGEDGIGTGNS